jgi:hypothetical protein
MPTSTDFNDNHPEMRPGEKFLLNHYVGKATVFKYKSARIGKTAYNRDGSEIANFVPVFVSCEEYDRFQKPSEVQNNT